MASPGNMNSQTRQNTTSPGSNNAATARSGAVPHQRQRNDGQFVPGRQAQEDQLTSAESWVEVSSHPSSSSVSSIGEEIVTTGLQVGSSAWAARRRRLHPQSYNHVLLQQQQEQQHQQYQQQLQQQQQEALKNAHAGASSQEEYDESETDSDHVLTSSTENIPSVPGLSPTPLRNAHPADEDTSDEENDDENATALGVRRPSESFRPQPNAFSHPPSHLQHRHSTSSSIPHHHPRPSFSQRSSARVDRRTPNFMSPNYQADSDEALRASLTTLLSCAAAARGLGKDGEKEVGEPVGQTSSQPMNLRLVPESELMDDTPRPTASGRVLRTEPTQSHSREVAKTRRAATPTPVAKQPRATRKKRTSSAGEDALISPTFFTWVVGAGVVILVSAVGFGAGFVIGREVGRQENLAGLAAAGNATSDGGSCGREVIRSSGGTLRRFRWGIGKGIVV